MAVAVAVSAVAIAAEPAVTKATSISLAKKFASIWKSCRLVAGQEHVTRNKLNRLQGLFW